MTFRLTFKTPDVLDQIDYQYCTAEECEKAREFAKRWLHYGESITVVFNPEQGTATVEHK